MSNFIIMPNKIFLSQNFAKRGLNNQNEHPLDTSLGVSMQHYTIIALVWG